MADTRNYVDVLDFGDNVPRNIRGETLITEEQWSIINTLLSPINIAINAITEEQWTGINAILS